MVEKAEARAKYTLLTIILALVLWGGYQVYDDILHPLALNMVPLNLIQQLQCRWAAEGAVRQALRTPAMVSFHYGQVKPPHHNPDGSVTVAGYVAAQNRSGVQTRNPFKVILSETFNDVVTVDVRR